MIAFRDRRGRLWAARIDIDAAQRIRELAGVDVMHLAADPAAVEELAGPSKESSATLANALFCLFLPTCERERLTAGQFGKRLRNVTADELRTLFFEGVTAFFKMPGPEKKSSGDAVETTAAELWRSVYRMAGEAGIEPGPRTFGELAVASEGRRRDEWSRTAALRADVRNSNPYRQGPPDQPADLDPTGALKEAGARRANTREITADDIGFLARMFCPRK